METPVSDEVQDVLLHLDVEAGDLVHFHRVADLEAGELPAGIQLDVHLRAQYLVRDSAAFDFDGVDGGPSRAAEGREMEVAGFLAQQVDLVGVFRQV
jgi:hypothetical protein